jgi:hypothetical protein
MSSLAPITAAPVTAGRVGSDPSSTAMPVVNEARAPASVRNGSTSVKQAYANAQGFEEMLLQQLSSSLVQSSGLSGEGESGEASGEESSSEGGGEAGGMLSSLLPQSLAEGVMRDGGLGMAGQLMSSLDPVASTARAAGASAAASSGPSAPAPAVAANGVTPHSGGASA